MTIDGLKNQGNNQQLRRLSVEGAAAVKELHERRTQLIELENAIKKLKEDNHLLKAQRHHFQVEAKCVRDKLEEQEGDIKVVEAQIKTASEMVLKNNEKIEHNSKLFQRDCHV